MSVFIPTSGMHTLNLQIYGPKEHHAEEREFIAIGRMSIHFKVLDRQTGLIAHANNINANSVANLNYTETSPGGKASQLPCIFQSVSLLVVRPTIVLFNPFSSFPH